ncbi:MAG: DUF4258 domain-containing protein [Candidatus Electryonea clarkiae]|nr:DUF4258 domain-containing protein [Candidatus Electryonea clarkiae]MDP8285927.1 DUF4258 domain-containing protein [Candidatus Electryonea clarkiae]
MKEIKWFSDPWFEAIKEKRVSWQKHALQRMLERNIHRLEIMDVIKNGEVIEHYPEDRPFPSALFFKSVEEKPLHVVASFDEIDKLIYIITVYIPDSRRFEEDFKTRK